MKFSEQVLLEMRLVRAKACAVTGDCRRARVKLLQLFFVYFLSPFIEKKRPLTPLHLLEPIPPRLLANRGVRL